MRQSPNGSVCAFFQNICAESEKKGNINKLRYFSLFIVERFQRSFVLVLHLKLETTEIFNSFSLTSCLIFLNVSS